MRVVHKFLTGVIVAAGLGVAATMLVPATLGLQRYVITGGSMTGTYNRGSIVFDHPVPVAELRVGDVITYRPPPTTGVDGLVTHRIVSIGRDARRGDIFRTKGDANPKPDPWRFALARPTQARVAFALPYLGYGLATLSLRFVRMLVIGVPAILIAIVLIARLWREAGEEARAREDATTAGAADALAP